MKYLKIIYYLIISIILSDYFTDDATHQIQVCFWTLWLFAATEVIKHSKYEVKN